MGPGKRTDGDTDPLAFQRLFGRRQATAGNCAVEVAAPSPRLFSEVIIALVLMIGAR